MSFNATQMIGFGAGGGGYTVASSPTYVNLISGTSWTVPSDWNSSTVGSGGFANKIQCFGAGGGGSSNETAGGGGGGGGAFSEITDLTLTPGGSVTYAIGTAGSVGSAGGDTYFNGASLGAASVGAKGGSAGSGSTGGSGGASASGVGTTKRSGGNGGNGGGDPDSGGGGGSNGATDGTSGVGCGGLITIIYYALTPA